MFEKSISLRELFFIMQDLQKINIKGVKINFIISQLKKQIEELHKDYTSSIKIPNKYKEFEQKKIDVLLDLNSNLSDEDKNANKVEISTSNGIIQLPVTKFTEYQNKVKDLANEYKDAIEEYKKVITEAETLLDKKVTIRLMKLRLDELPEDVDTKTMDVLVKLDVIEG